MKYCMIRCLPKIKKNVFQAENIRILREYKSGIQEVLADRKTSLDDIQATDSIVLCDVGDFNQETERIIGT